MTWTILDHAKKHVNGSSKCDLCLTEKYHIINSTLISLTKELITKRETQSYDVVKKIIVLINLYIYIYIVI